jgi:uncharacterized protein YlxW (UPF0749 family)
MTHGASVSKNWLIGILTTLAMMGGAGWLTAVHSQVSQMKTEQAKDRETVQQIQQDTAVAKERLRRVEDDTKEIKQEQKEQGRKLDEILRRVK